MTKTATKPKGDTTSNAALEAYAEDAKPPIGHNSLAMLGDLAEQQAKAEADVVRLEKELKAAQDKLKDISEFKLPTAMDELKLTEFKTSSGLKIEIQTKVFGNITKEKWEDAKTWLEENKFSKLIKREFKINFGKEDVAWAKKFEADLKRRKKPLVVSRKETIHPQTLNAFVAEQLEKGNDIPLETFGVHKRRVAKVNR